MNLDVGKIGASGKNYHSDPENNATASKLMDEDLDDAESILKKRAERRSSVCDRLYSFDE
jgi:hypothetical protein